MTETIDPGSGKELWLDGNPEEVLVLATEGPALLGRDPFGELDEPDPFIERIEARGPRRPRLRAVPEPPAAAEAEWPCWRGPDRNGISPDTGLLKQWPEAGPKLLWQVDGLGKGFSTVAVTGGNVYVTGDVGDSLTLFLPSPDMSTTRRSAA